MNEAGAVEIYRDVGISGKRSDNRPGLQRLLRRVEAGDALVVYSLSRLARSTKDTLAIAELLEKRGANLVSLSERIDTTTASGKMVFRMLAVLSEFERDQVSERTRMALAHKRANSEKTGGHVPYGFRLKAGRRLVEDAAEQAVLAWMRRQRAAGVSLRQISRDLEASGHRTRTGLTRWHPQCVKQILMRQSV